MESMNWTQIVVSFLIGGGLSGLVTAFFKVRPEAGKIVVDAAKGAVIVQTAVIEQLKQSLAEARAEVRIVRDELQKLQDRLEEVLKENSRLRTRLEALQAHQRRHDKEIKDLCK